MAKQSLYVRALRKNYDKIIESTLDPFNFAVKLLSTEIISGETYRLVTDRASSMTGSDRLRILVDSLVASITLNKTVFNSLLGILKDIGGATCTALSEQLELTYQGNLNFSFYLTLFV